MNANTDEDKRDIAGAIGSAIGVTLVFCAAIVVMSSVAAASWNCIAARLLGCQRAGLTEGLAMVAASWVLSIPWRAAK